MPWGSCSLFNHVPVPWQDSMSLSLFFCSGEAAQGTRTQQNSEELGGPGTAHRWCPAHYKLVSRYPPSRKAPLQALGRTRKILGSARAQCQDSPACAAHKGELNTPLNSPSRVPDPQILPCLPLPLLFLWLPQCCCFTSVTEGLPAATAQEPEPEELCV